MARWCALSKVLMRYARRRSFQGYSKNVPGRIHMKSSRVAVAAVAVMAALACQSASAQSSRYDGGGHASSPAVSEASFKGQKATLEWSKIF
jgi:hypothetical protein